VSTTRFPGLSIKVGERTLLVPPLSLNQLEIYKNELDAIDELEKNPGEAIKSGGFGKVLKIMHAAISRNYPEMSLEEAGNLVDLGNFKQFLAAVTGASVGEATGQASD
jgi:hypothetical protein